MGDDTVALQIEDSVSTAQWFGFTVEEFSEEIKNRMLDIIEDALEDMHEKIANEPVFTKGVKRNDLQIAMYNMNCLMSRDLLESYDKFQDYLHANVFHIPKNVSMHPTELTRSSTIEEEEAVDKEIELLTSKIKKSYATSCKLEKEIEEIDAAQLPVERLNQQLEKKESAVKALLKAIGDAETTCDSIIEMKLQFPIE